MTPTRRLILKAIIVFAIAAGFIVGPAQAANLVVGVNLDNPMRANVADQNAMISALKAAGVYVIRAGISPDDKGVDFAKRLYAAGIKMDLILGFKYSANAPTRAYQPKEFPAMWGGHPLSYADPELTRAYFQMVLGKLEDSGIVLEGLELGNEINWTAFNPEFPLPGEGMNFGLDDLYRDPEAKQVAKGFLQYLKILAALKDVRDQCKLNKHTPIILAGLADSGPPGPKKSKLDSVSVNDTIQFLRANGLDKLVDAYGIHTYPWEKTPANRKSRLEKYAVAECGTGKSGSGKPCWMTEWGFANKDMSCPLDDSARATLVKDMMNDFRELAKQGRLVGEIYFAWNTDPWAKQVDPLTIFRCGELTKAGKLALQH